MTENYIDDMDKSDQSMLRYGIRVEEDAIVELTVINRLHKELYAGNISIETVVSALKNMNLVSGYEDLALDEL